MIMNSSGQNEMVCNDFTTYATPRYILIVCIATPLALIGVVSNALLLCTFCSKKSRQNSDIFLGAMALLDEMMCLLYLIMFTTDAIASFHLIEWMWIAWHWYTRPVMSFSSIVQASISFVTLVATIERVSVVGGARQGLGIMPNLTKKLSGIFGAILIAFLLRIWSFLAYRVVDHPLCHQIPFERFEWELIWQSKKAYIHFSFYGVSVFQVLIPFVLLCVMNVYMMYKVSANGTLSSAQVKPITYRMLALVSSFLICNSLDFTIKILEQFFSYLLDEYALHYDYATDCVSILFMINSMNKIFLYYWLDPDFCKKFQNKKSVYRKSMREAGTVLLDEDREGKRDTSYECGNVNGIIYNV